MPSENPVKVLLVGDYPPPYGGVAVHVEVMQRAVRESGGRCDVLDVGKGQLPADGVVAGASYFAFAAHVARYAIRGFRIHAHTSGANRKSWMMAAACAAAGKISGRPSLITFHSGLGPEWLAADPLRARIACAIGNSFGTVIAVSGEIRGALLACGVSGDRIEVLPAFSRSFLVPGEPPPGLRELREEAAPLYCAMLAPGPVYGKEPLLRAFALVHRQNPQARLVLYGPGTDELGADLARLCGSAALAVRGFGEVHRPSALALLASCDVFVRPTLADGDSVSVREAVALGRAVVATSVGTRPPEARLVAPGDADALAASLLDAAGEHPALRVANGSEEGQSADCVRRLLDLYSGGRAARGSGARPAVDPSSGGRPKGIGAPVRGASGPSSAGNPVESPACAASAAS